MASTSETQPSFTLASLLIEATRVFGDSDLAIEWVNTRVRSLGDRRPADMMAGSPTDQELVFSILGRIEHGIF